MTRSYRRKYDPSVVLGPQPNLNRYWRSDRIRRYHNIQFTKGHRQRFRYKPGNMLGRVVKGIIDVVAKYLGV